LQRKDFIVVSILPLCESKNKYSTTLTYFEFDTPE